MRLHYGCAVELAKIMASLTGFYATSPYICGYVIPESRVGSAIGVFYAPCCREGRGAKQTLAISKIKTNIVGNSVPEIRAADNK